MPQSFTVPLRRKLGFRSLKRNNKKTDEEDFAQVAAWAASFDILLGNKSGFNLFNDFLKDEFSEENLEFWKNCEDYKNIPDCCTRNLVAKAIYDFFMSPESPRTVNIDDSVRQRVEAQLDSPAIDVFVEAQTQIYKLMKQDSYPRFLKSEIYMSRLMSSKGKKLKDKPVSMDTRSVSKLDMKSRTLQRQFTVTSNKSDTSNITTYDGKLKFSWIRSRFGSISNMLRRDTRNIY